MSEKGLMSKIYKKLIQFKSTEKFQLTNEQRIWISQRRHTDGQEVHEKVLNNTNYQRNANENHNEMSPHTC